jgi:CBS domain-containing protein
MADKVRDIMTPDPVCCLTTDSVQRAAQLMRDEDIGSVPVISDPQRKGLVGIVTDRDLTITVLAEARDARTTMVGDVMSSQVVSCRADDDADKVMDLMARYQLRRIPVVDANNSILGIVAQADVAVRMEEPRKTAEVVERISQPNESNQVR